MQTGQLRQNAFALTAALIWGTAFVAQSVGAEFVPAFAFNALRSVVAFVALLLLCLLRRRLGRVDARTSLRDLALGGLCCGGVMAFAAFCQQKGLESTGAGKAGFLTAMYIVIVPLAGLFFRKRVARQVWTGVLLASAGLYLLCVKEGFSVDAGDGWVILCAFGFAGHILVIDRFTQKTDAIELSCAQFLVMSVLSALGSALFGESVTLAGVASALLPILFVGVLSSGVAYTLQILAQKDADPAVISLLLSMESVFAALAGAIFLHERMSGKEVLGCVLMLAAIVTAQLPERDRAGGNG